MSEANGQLRLREALVADIGRTAIRLALTDESGRLKQDSIRIYDPSIEATIPGVIARFGAESGLKTLPSRSAVAISGVPRGDLIPVTNSRLMLSRTDLADLLGAPPLILNDFAANAWAMTTEECSARVEGLCGPPVTSHAAGSYCIIGVGSGLGVALLTRDAHGVTNVLPTEGGHMGFMAGLDELEPVAALIGARKGHLSGETMLSQGGLVLLYQALAKIRGIDVLCVPDLMGSSAAKSDPLVSETHALFAKILWHFAGNMVLAYGAWDGIILTGSVIAALRPALRRPDLAQQFIISGPYSNRLREVPRASVSAKFAELEGAAIALLNEERRRAGLHGFDSSAVSSLPARRPPRHSQSQPNGAPRIPAI